jgi:DDE superfamily endonuclease
MKEYVQNIIEPYRKARITEHNLDKDAHVLLNLDVWAVHISAEFRTFLDNEHPHIHLVYVPANCTSKLQVADIALNYPFKHGFKRRFTRWAAGLIHSQIIDGQPVGLKSHCGMTAIKPKVLSWAFESWKSLSTEKLLIQKGWQLCVIDFYDVLDKEQRVKAMRIGIQAKRPSDAVPEEKEESAAEIDEEGFIAEESEDEEKTEKQIMKERVFGERRSTRTSTQPDRTGYMLSTTQVKFN